MRGGGKCGARQGGRESVLFIGTRFSNLYTAVDTPAEAAWLCKSSRVFSIPTLACVLMHNEMHARAETARGRESKCERARVVCSGPFKKFFPCNHLRAREKRSNTIPIKALIFLWTLGMMRASDPSFCPDPAPHPGVNCRVHT